MRSLADTPPSRHPARAITDAASRWWVAKLKPRQEKAFAADLLRNDIEYYLPMVTHVTRRRDNNKPRKSILPLFPGYISFAQDVPNNIFTGGRVAGIIEVHDQQRFVHELSQIYSALESGAVLEPLLDHFDPGMRVRVRSGALRGLEGTVARVRGENRLVLEVEPFGRAMVTVDSSLVEPISEQAWR